MNLEVLWLNGNRLSRLDSLDSCFRIKTIYAQDNRISSLKDSSVSFMTFIHTLILANNLLSDLPLTLQVLSRLGHLTTLDLSGNPIAEEKA